MSYSAHNSPIPRLRDVQTLLLRLTDAGLACIMFVAPMFMGGRHPLGKLVFVALVAATSIAWAARQCLVKNPTWTRCSAQWLLIAGLGLVVCQLVPWPESLLLNLSPTVGELLPQWTSQTESTAHLGIWSQLSLRPAETRSGLVMYLAYAMLFLVVVQRIDSVRDVQRLVRWLALAAVFMALLGLAQFLFGNGKFLWVYADPSRDTTDCVKGPFFNQNHFAHVMALGIGPLVWWLTIAMNRAANSKRKKRGISQKPGLDHATHITTYIGVGLGIVALAGLLTFSRGGVIAIVVSALVSVGLLTYLGQLSKRLLAGIVVVCCFLVLGLFVYGYDPLMRELQTLEQSQSLENLSQARRDLWQAHLNIVQRFPLTGTGIGSHRQIYPTYLDKHYDFTFQYGESGFMQLLVEAGLPGLLLLLSGIGLTLWWTLSTVFKKVSGTVRPGGQTDVRSEAGTRQGRSRAPLTDMKACAAGLTAAVVASVVQSVVDFVWYIPACMSLTVVIAACACRLRQLACRTDCQSVPDGMKFHPTLVAANDRGTGSVHKRYPTVVSSFSPRVCWLTATFVTVLLGVISVRTLLPAALAMPYWNEYVTAAEHWEKHRGESPQSSADLKELTAALEESHRCDPMHDEVHLKLASAYQVIFEIEQQRSTNPMPLSQIRSAVEASDFRSPKERDEWLSRAVGEHLCYLNKAHYHARRAAQLCPLQGEAYVYIGNLAFLGHQRTEGRGQRSEIGGRKTDLPLLGNQLVEQALRVRPHSGTVLLEAGSAAILADDLEQGLAHWKKLFQWAPQYRSAIIKRVAPQTSAKFVLEQFQPDVDGLAELFSFYRQSGRNEDAGLIGQPYVKALEERAGQLSGNAAGNAWQQAHEVHRFLGDDEAALSCMRRAARAMPMHAGVRRTLAETLIVSEQFDDAIREIEWCMRRNPQDDSLRQLHADAHRLRLDKKIER